MIKELGNFYYVFISMNFWLSDDLSVFFSSNIINVYTNTHRHTQDLRFFILIADTISGFLLFPFVLLNVKDIHTP